MTSLPSVRRILVLFALGLAGMVFFASRYVSSGVTWTDIVTGVLAVVTVAALLIGQYDASRIGKLELARTEVRELGELLESLEQFIGFRNSHEQQEHDVARSGMRFATLAPSPELIAAAGLLRARLVASQAALPLTRQMMNHFGRPADDEVDAFIKDLSAEEFQQSVPDPEGSSVFAAYRAEIMRALSAARIRLKALSGA